MTKFEAYNNIVSHYEYRIERLVENNIMSRLGKGYNKSIVKCLAKTEDRHKKSKLNLYDLASAFFVLGLGSSISLLIFVIELILVSRNKRATTHVHNQQPAGVDNQNDNSA